MSSPRTPKTPTTPTTPTSPSSPRISPGKLKIFFQDLHRDSRQKFGSFFGGCTYRRKKSDLEATPILLDMPDNAEHRESVYGATGSHVNEDTAVPVSATKRTSQNRIQPSPPTKSP